MSENNPYDRLERLFHEPKRLAIISLLIASMKGMTFADLKKGCDMTDGNLSRHLKTLSEKKIIEIKKAFVGARPQTTVEITSVGRKRFIEYLEALEQVLEKAEKNIQQAERKDEHAAKASMVINRGQLAK